MLDKLKGIEDRYEQIGSELLEVGTNYQRAAELNKERVDLEPLYQKAREYRQAVKSLEEARSIFSTEKDPELVALAEADIAHLTPKIEALETEIKGMLVPKDPRDDKSVIVEIRAGAGGDEAAIFAADLFRMYTRYADGKRWKPDILSENAIGVGGYKEIIFEIKGKGAYSKLKYVQQVANPVLAGVTWLGRRYPGLKVVGLCHGFMGVYNLADQLGLSREGLRFEIPGVNHFVWLNALEHEGRDALPLVDRWIAELAPDYWQRCRPSDGLGPAPVDLYRRLGRFPIGDTATPGGGSWPAWYHADDAVERRWHEGPMAWWDEVYFGKAEQTVAKLRRVAEEPLARVTDLVPPGMW